MGVCVYTRQRLTNIVAALLAVLIIIFQLQRKDWELIICELIKNVCMIIRVATAEWQAEEVGGGASSRF